MQRQESLNHLSGSVWIHLLYKEILLFLAKYTKLMKDMDIKMFTDHFIFIYLRLRNLGRVLNLKALIGKNHSNVGIFLNFSAVVK